MSEIYDRGLGYSEDGPVEDKHYAKLNKKLPKSEHKRRKQAELETLICKKTCLTCKQTYTTSYNEHKKQIVTNDRGTQSPSETSLHCHKCLAIRRKERTPTQ